MKILCVLVLLTITSCGGSGGSSPTSSAGLTDTTSTNVSSYTIGESIQGGLYAGTYNGNQLVITPSGCTDSTTPVCNGTADGAVLKRWSNDTGGFLSITSASNGFANTFDLVNAIGVTITYAEAAQYCNDMTYGGYTDWYLPSQNELAEIMINNATNSNIFNFKDQNSGNGGVIPMRYWSSTESTVNNQRATTYEYDSTVSPNYFVGTAVKVGTSNGVGAFWLTRCIRKF